MWSFGKLQHLRVNSVCGIQALSSLVEAMQMIDDTALETDIDVVPFRSLHTLSIIIVVDFSQLERGLRIRHDYNVVLKRLKTSVTPVILSLGMRL